MQRHWVDGLMDDSCGRFWKRRRENQVGGFLQSCRNGSMPLTCIGSVIDATVVLYCHDVE